MPDKFAHLLAPSERPQNGKVSEASPEDRILDGVEAELRYAARWSNVISTIEELATLGLMPKSAADAASDRARGFARPHADAVARLFTEQGPAKGPQVPSGPAAGK